MNVNREYFTPTQTANLFGVCPRTVYNWLRTKQLEGMKIGNRWLVPIAAIKKNCDPTPSKLPPRYDDR